MTVLLRYRPPYDWPAMAAFLKARAIPGVEVVSTDRYARTIDISGVPGVVVVEPSTDNALRIAVRFSQLATLPTIITRLRSVFDLAADPQAINGLLAEDRLLAPLVAARPGLRVPGAWDGFELAVLAVLGQQITVAAAVGLAGKLVAHYGLPLSGTSLEMEGLTHVFPRPEHLASADLTALGMPRARAATLASLAADRAKRHRMCDAAPCSAGHRRMDRAVHRNARIPGTGCVSSRRRQSVACGDQRERKKIDTSRAADESRALATMACLCGATPVGIWDAAGTVSSQDYMTTQSFDVVIVGARCAGATLATFLARSGASVALLDKDRLRSDQILSTHTIHPPGFDVLDDVGVGDAVRAVAPPTHVVRLRKNEAFVDIEFPAERAEYCPRRGRLDGLLQGAAASAGVEVLDRTRVTSLVREGDRVVGVRAVGSGGEELVFRASLVVGADGRHSTVARNVEAEEYFGYDAPRAMFWGYWDAPGFWRTDPTYPFGMYVANTDGHIRVIFQTDHGQLLIGSLPPVVQAIAWRSDPDAALIADLASDSTTGPLIAGSTPDGRIRGTVKERYFFRRAAGNGWALVGDAGHHKEFVIGDGITEALLQARSLAVSIARGTDAALQRWWRARDVEALPYFFLGRDEGALGPPKALQQVVFSHVTKVPSLRARMAATMEHQLAPHETFSVQQVLWWTLGAAFQGSLRVIPEFIAMARRGSANDRELRLRQRLLAEAETFEAQAAHADPTPGSVVLPPAAESAPRGPRTNATP